MTARLPPLIVSRAQTISVLKLQVKIGSPSSHGLTLRACFISFVSEISGGRTTKSSCRFVMATERMVTIGIFLSSVVDTRPSLEVVTTKYTALSVLNQLGILPERSVTHDNQEPRRQFTRSTQFGNEKFSSRREVNPISSCLLAKRYAEKHIAYQRSQRHSSASHPEH